MSTSFQHHNNVSNRETFKSWKADRQQLCRKCSIILLTMLKSTNIELTLDHNPMTVETEWPSHHQVQLILFLNFEIGLMYCAAHFKQLNTVRCCS